MLCLFVCVRQFKVRFRGSIIIDQDDFTQDYSMAVCGDRGSLLKIHDVLDETLFIVSVTFSIKITLSKLLLNFFLASCANDCYCQAQYKSLYPISWFLSQRTMHDETFETCNDIIQLHSFDLRIRSHTHHLCTARNTTHPPTLTMQQSSSAIFYYFIFWFCF